MDENRLARLPSAPASQEQKSPAVRPAVADLQRRFEKIAQRDAGLVEAMNRFADLTDEEFKKLNDLLVAGQKDELKARGWSVKALRVALAARLPRAQVPFAMLAAHERTGMRIRRLQPKAASAKVNVAIIQIHERAPRKTDAEVQVVEEKK
jgi:hypothetical protein